MVAWRYGSYLLVFNSIAHSFAALTRDISSWPLERKFRISKGPCIILYVFYASVRYGTKQDFNKSSEPRKESFCKSVCENVKSAHSKVPIKVKEQEHLCTCWEWMKGIYDIWSTDQRFSPSQLGDWYLKRSSLKRSLGPRFFNVWVRLSSVCWWGLERDVCALIME